MSAIVDKPRPGKPSKLTQEQIKLLNDSIEKSPKLSNLETDAWSTNLIRNFIAKQFKQRYSMFGTRKLLKRLGFSLQKPRPIHHLGNKSEQENFKKNFDEQSKFSNEKVTKYSIWTKQHS